MRHALTDRTTLVLFALCAAFLALGASCTATEVAATAGTVAALGTAAASLLDVVAPLMTPEQFAEFRAGVEGIDGTVQATKSVLTVVVDAFETFKEAVDAKNQAVGAALQATQVELAGKAGTGEAVGYALGGGAGGTALSRVLSLVKHGKPAPATT